MHTLRNWDSYKEVINDGFKPSYIIYTNQKKK